MSDQEEGEKKMRLFQKEDSEHIIVVVDGDEEHSRTKQSKFLVIIGTHLGKGCVFSNKGKNQHHIYFKYIA